jgi:hypothetical protein
MAGCTFTRRLEPLPVPATVAEPLEASVVLVIDRPWTFFGDPAPRLAHIDRARIEAALRASGCVTFSTVRLEVHPVVALLAFPVAIGQALDSSDPDLPRLELVLTLEDEEDWHLLAPLTLGLFPRYQEDHLALCGTLRAPGGEVLAQVERHERLGTWASCLLYPQLTFEFGAGRVDEALEGLVRCVAAEVAAREGERE